jgi:RNA:NAD 2'-phosphotransferase (TPT1/KptA family)
MKLYHVTPRVNVQSILVLGLIPAGPQWPVHLAFDDGFIELIQSLYETEDVVVLVVDVAGIPLYSGHDGPESMCTDWRISPDRITVRS